LILFLGIFLYSDTISLSQEEKDYLVHKKIITMCVDPDWEPFEIINKNGIHEGIAGDLIRLVQKRLDIKIILVPTKSWEESLEKSKNYDCDIMSFLNQTPKREAWLTFTEPIFKDPNVLVGRAENQYIEDLSKIKASIALPYGTAMSELFARDFPNLTIIPTVTENEAFKLVEEKKADLTLRSMIVAAYTIKKEGLFNLKIIGQPQGYENKLRIGVRKDEPILRDILNKGIATITEDDTQNIINKHVTIIIEKVTHITIGFWIALGLVFVSLLVVLWNYTLRKKVALEVAKNLQKQEIMFQQNKQAEVGNLVGNISHQGRDGLSNIGAINLEIMAKIDFGIDITKEELKKS
jgi:ABC-type amino acid transport substrate-binding protein